jgi:hypothetical protein
MFVARTLAYTLDPHGKLNGAASKVEVGIVQLAFVSTAMFDPSQLA